MLDSWVRYEQQLKESEQVELTKTVIDKVLANIREPKTQQEILAGAVAEVERGCLALFSFAMTADPFQRTRQEQGYLIVETSCVPGILFNRFISNIPSHCLMLSFCLSGLSSRM